MRVTLLLLVVLTLAGCDPTEEEQARVRRALPPGCSVQDVGSYGDVRHLVIVDCTGRRTTTESYEEAHGKGTHSMAVVFTERNP